jgi:hypothetical protein|tara:strand:+ start:5962 stop:6450 length:489 start_codon:yes stop_codon:yes gene_type:complete
MQLKETKIDITEEEMSQEEFDNLVSEERKHRDGVDSELMEVSFLDDEMSEVEFDNLVSEETKHRELIEAIYEVISAVKPVGGSSEISELVETKKGEVDSFLSKLKDITVNNEELISTSKEINKTFINIQEILSEKKKWEFKVNRSNKGNIIGVTAIQIKSKT